MKSSLSLIVPSILILCLIEGCSGPVEPTQAPVASSIPDSVLERLELQAMKIAHTYLVENTFTYEQDSLHVPQWALDTIGKALNAIWLSQSAERDTVMGIYKIEPNCSIDFKTIYVQGHIDTAKYSALLAKYSLREMQSGAGFQFFQSTKYWNTSALCQKITEALDENDKVSMDPMGLNGVSGDFITPKFKFDGSDVRRRPRRSAVRSKRSRLNKKGLLNEEPFRFG